MQWNVESGGSAGAEGVLLNNKIGNFPRRQMEAGKYLHQIHWFPIFLILMYLGKSYGLSFLLNPNLEEYFCTTSDSTGFRLQTHWPTDTPHVTDFGISIRTKAEVFVNVKPDITLVDPSVFKFDKVNIGTFVHNFDILQFDIPQKPKSYAARVRKIKNYIFGVETFPFMKFFNFTFLIVIYTLYISSMYDI